MKIYALKPFEVDIGSVLPPAESFTPSTMATSGGRGTSGDVTLSPSGVLIVEPDASSTNSNTSL